MARKELEERTKRFALAVIRFAGSLPKSKAADILARQLLRSATSIGANYREANRAESRRDFIHKIAVVEKEAAETCYWLELVQEAISGCGDASSKLLKEANELLAIFTTIGRRTKAGVNEPDASYGEEIGLPLNHDDLHDGY